MNVSVEWKESEEKPWNHSKVFVGQHAPPPEASSLPTVWAGFPSGIDGWKIRLCGLRDALSVCEHADKLLLEE